VIAAFSPALFSSSYAGEVRAILGKPIPATPQEIADAAEIVAAAPQNVSGIEVAQYFETLAMLSPDGHSYNAAWPGDKENPLIILFFVQATDTPAYASDETPWCAAFVNWCLMRAGKDGTKSASSGSFRCVGQPSAVSATGDIAVFKNPGEDEPCAGMGHVAFFVEYVGDLIRVLGGNQHHRIATSTYYKDFSHAQPIALLSTRDYHSIP
jgi:uncharacterized protein (TIGR02594 family)